jgi:hypothetical protein
MAVRAQNLKKGFSGSASVQGKVLGGSGFKLGTIDVKGEGKRGD